RRSNLVGDRLLFWLFKRSSRLGSFGSKIKRKSCVPIIRADVLSEASCFQFRNNLSCEHALTLSIVHSREVKHISVCIGAICCDVKSGGTLLDRFKDCFDKLLSRGSSIRSGGGHWS